MATELATTPPRPESISSNSSVSTSSSAVKALLMASMILLSSPPDATWLTGPSFSPLLAARVKTTSSMPLASAWRRVITILKTALLSPSDARLPWMVFSRERAQLPLCALRATPVLISSHSAFSTLRPLSASRSSKFSMVESALRYSSRLETTASREPPYFFFSLCRSARRALFSSSSSSLNEMEDRYSPSEDAMSSSSIDADSMRSR